jgi:MFS family permease
MLKHRWNVLALLVFTRGAMGFQFQSIAALVPLLRRDLGLTPAQIGALIGLYMLPGVLVAIPAALVGRWLGGKRTVLVALALMAAGGFGFATSSGFTSAAVSRLIGGTGMALLNVMVTKMVADRFVGKESATAMGLLLAVWPAGIALALATLGGVAVLSSWQVSAALTGLWPLVALAGMAVLYRDPVPVPAARAVPAAPAATAASATRATPSEAAAVASPRPPFVRLLALGSVSGWAWTLYNCGLITLISFVPTMLTTRGESLAQAGLVSSFITWGVMVGTPLGGMVTDWIRRPFAIVVFACVSSTALIALAAVGSSITHFLLMGMCIGLPTGPIMAMLGEALPESERGLGYGVLLSWYYLGLGIVPAVAGFVQERTGTALSVLILSSALVLATLPAYAGFQWLKQGRVVLS